MQLSRAWLCPWEEVSFAALPNSLPFALLTCPPRWAGALRALCMWSPLPRGILLPPATAGTPRLCSPPASPDLGVWVQPCLMDSHRLTGMGNSSFGYGQRPHRRSERTTVSVAIFQLEKRKFPTIIRAGRSCKHFLGKRLEQGPDVVLRQCLTCPQEGGLVAGMEPRTAWSDRPFTAVRLRAGGRAGSAAMGQAWDSAGLVDHRSILSSHSASPAPPLFPGGLGRGQIFSVQTTCGTRFPVLTPPRGPSGSAAKTPSNTQTTSPRGRAGRDMDGGALWYLGCSFPLFPLGFVSREEPWAC